VSNHGGTDGAMNDTKEQLLNPKENWATIRVSTLSESKF